jgi:hypothetical protein
LPFGFYGAEAAGTGTNIPQDHKRGGPRAPTFALIRALGFIADRMEPVFQKSIRYALPGIPGRETDPNPIRLGEKRRYHENTIPLKRIPGLGSFNKFFLT